VPRPKPRQHSVELPDSRQGDKPSEAQPAARSNRSGR
jgi:hypothetical protein